MDGLRGKRVKNSFFLPWVGSLLLDVDYFWTVVSWVGTFFFGASLVAAISRVGNYSSVLTIFFLGTNSDADEFKFDGAALVVVVFDVVYWRFVVGYCS